MKLIQKFSYFVNVLKKEEEGRENEEKKKVKTQIYNAKRTTVQLRKFIFGYNINATLEPN